MPYTRFVEVGRIVLINYGPETGKLATIVDIVDNNKCLIDGPRKLTGVQRQIIPFKRIALTDFKVDIPKAASQKTLTAAIEAADILGKWESTSWAKKLAAKKKRANLSDFDRFKLMVARKQKAKIVADKVKQMS
uniref:Large ribosomal subunit protein eL14 domain-containing protein n=1 Tax=Octactis speculum TaxID=3111310 RepID=A0A7S2AMT7_9STRA|mmetsp:Transcript_12098/g.15949  ORF Transcript_12098/g.15949 Transcript_12098/m.15949 type:complete len:134 (+) Transcript_12098:61-462(+)